MSATRPVGARRPVADAGRCTSYEAGGGLEHQATSRRLRHRQHRCGGSILGGPARRRGARGRGLAQRRRRRWVGHRRQAAPNYVPPDWPAGPQQQVHLDLHVDDFRSARAHAGVRRSAAISAAAAGGQPGWGRVPRRLRQSGGAPLLLRRAL